MSFKDHFASLAANYASFRPRYPSSLFDYLAQSSPRRECAWDCACGSGHATLDLAARFAAVIATDASAAQVAAAPPHPHRAIASHLPKRAVWTPRLSTS